ncbi:hypothetical protein RhiJN_01783 [Ceratobasidium sp. AG-Ba]|nr:hypothetical protein RhiJN_01783 [Ceratobasidium sp. AG-Ba]QRW02717.1 hypothetical protein RhiLY_01716 [Ceratobasidium sp. AG-Ba]
MSVPDIKPEPAPRDSSGSSETDVVMRSDDIPPAPDRPPSPPPKQVADSEISNVNQPDAPSHEGPSVQSPVSDSPAHIVRPISPSNSTPNAQLEDVTMDSVADAPKALPESAHSPAPAASTSPPPASLATSSVAPSYSQPAPSAPIAPTPSPAHPPVNHAPLHADIPLTMVQTTQGDQGLTARQLGQRARRARERELQAQGLYTPKRRTSSSATLPDLSSFTTISHVVQAPTQPSPGTLPDVTPPSQDTSNAGDVTMQSVDGDGDDDGEGELEADLTSQSVGHSALPGSTPAVPPHTASHLIPPIAVLAPVATPSRASLAQRARRERERAQRLGLTPSPSGATASTSAPPTYVAPVQTPIPFNPIQVPPGSTHVALGQIPQQPPTLTRGQLAQRARRARERVERASKVQNAEGWTPQLNSQEGVSSAGEAVFAVAPPPPSVNGTAAFATTATQHNPGYGVGLGANHVPQQLSRAQLAQRARRMRERQQRVAAAAADATNTPEKHCSSPSSVPPASPTVKQHMDQASRTSLSPMASSAAGSAPAQLSIGAQFAQVFKSLTAGDNGVSRAVGDTGALTSKDDVKGRHSSHSPIERVASPTSGQRTDTQDGPDEFTDQLSEDSTRATTPGPDADPASPHPDTKAQSPVPEPKAEANVPERVASSTPPRAASPAVHMTSVQSVGA